jgi:hypothetical protein
MLLLILRQPVALDTGTENYNEFQVIIAVP